MSEEQNKIVDRNSEILFLYDAKQCNPNGDMDNENKPRMDWQAGRNLVSDVRLKRYVRDYLHIVKKEHIFVRKLGDEALKAEEAIALFKCLKEGKKESDLTRKDLDISNKELQKLGDDFFEMKDIRLFGATIPFAVETDGQKGSSSTFTGPVQFNWGYSLNRIEELQESRTITSHLRTGKSEQGAGIGKDYRVNYSFIAFSGGINANTAKSTKMTWEDVNLLDEAMIKSIPLNRTRSKIGQTPRLYLRVESSDNQTVLNDLREFISLDTKVDEASLRSIHECTLKAEDLRSYLDKNSSKIEKVHYWKDDSLAIEGLSFDGNDLFEEISLNEDK